MALKYSEDYKELVFSAWYKNNRAISKSLCNSLPVDSNNGKSPDILTITRWRDDGNWEERANSLDSAVVTSNNNKIISERIEMYKEHVQISNSLIAKGKEYLENHDILDAQDALRAITLGIEIQRASVGQASYGEKILSMGDEKLVKELQTLLGKPKTDDIINGEVV